MWILKICATSSKSSQAKAVNEDGDEAFELGAPVIDKLEYDLDTRNGRREKLGQVACTTDQFLQEGRQSEGISPDQALADLRLTAKSSRVDVDES